MKHAFSAPFLFKGNSIAVHEGFGRMLAFQTDMISICFQPIKLCETASGKEETMRLLDFIVICWSSGPFACFNFQRIPCKQEDTVLKQFFQILKTKRLIFTRKNTWSFPSITCVTVVPLHDLRCSRMWRPSRTWWDGNRWQGDELTGVEGANHGVIRSRKTWRKRQ